MADKAILDRLAALERLILEAPEELYHEAVGALELTAEFEAAVAVLRERDPQHSLLAEADTLVRKGTTPAKMRDIIERIANS